MRRQTTPSTPPCELGVRSCDATYLLTLHNREAGSALGLGLARTGASDDLGPGSDDTLHAEAFLRFTLKDFLQISPDIQYVENSGFDENLDAFVYGVRVAAFFSPG